MSLGLFECKDRHGDSEWTLKEGRACPGTHALLEQTPPHGCSTDDLARALARASCLGNKRQALVRAVQECNLNRVSNSTPNHCSADVKRASKL